MKRNKKKRFSDDIKYQRPDNRYEQEILQSLKLSEEERKYICVEEDLVFFSFPLKVNVSIWVGGNLLHEFGDRGYAYPLSSEQILSRDKEEELENIIYKKIGESTGKFFTDELHKGGFELNYWGKEVEFYKDIANVNEAKEAIKWLIDFKKRFDI